MSAASTVTHSSEKGTGNDPEICRHSVRGPEQRAKFMHRLVAEQKTSRPWRNCLYVVTCDEACGNGKMIRGADQRRH